MWLPYSLSIATARPPQRRTADDIDMGRIGPANTSIRSTTLVRSRVPWLGAGSLGWQAVRSVGRVAHGIVSGADDRGWLETDDHGSSWLLGCLTASCFASDGGSRSCGSHCWHVAGLGALCDGGAAVG